MTTGDAPAPVAAAGVERNLDAAIAFQRDLYLYWWAARALGELALTSRGMLTRATLRRLRAQWPVSDDDRAESDDSRRYFQRRLLERLGLLRVLTEAAEPAGSAESTEIPGRGERRLVAADAAMMARFLAHPLAERLRICVRLWVAGGWWSDGRPSDAPPSPHSLHTPAQPRVALARRRLVETLAALEPGSPVEMPGGAPLAMFGPRIIGATAQTARTKQRKPRDIAEERNQVMRAALVGPLRWLGLVVRDEIAGADAPGEMRLIVSRAALALRNEPDADEAAIPETPGRVIIQPNLDALAYPPLTAPTLFTLDSCATRGALERVAHYRLTRGDVTRAQREDWSNEEELPRRLESLTGQPLPGAVRVRLGDWARAADRIRLTPRATLLSTATPAVLDALLADRAAREWIVRRLGPTLALIPAEEIEAVRRWLLAHGELPAVEQPQE